MKRIIALLSVLCLAFTLSACSSQTKEAPSAGEQRHQVLVAYFSCTGNTGSVAEYIADALGADLYEIVPEQLYTSADLALNDDTTRAAIEQNDDAARPAISGSVEHMEDYSIVFLGYPIWWGDAPKIIATFLESYDFSGKTIIPFCTSNKTGIGSSATDLHGLTSASAHWLDGARFASGAAQRTVMEWLKELPVDIATQ